MESEMLKGAEIYTHTHTHGCLCKIIIPIIATFAIINPSYSDIDKNAQSATCDSSTIGTTTGPANLEAAWTANTINLDFYSDGEKISTGSCAYDGAIELPEDPENKTGYTFGGWQLRRAPAGPAQCNISDITSLKTSTNGSAYAFIKFDGTASTVSGTTRKTPDAYNITNNGEWAAEFSYGTIKGISRCSKVGSGYTRGQTGDPTDDLNQQGAQYCWCQLTGFDSDKDGEYCTTASLWVFDNANGSASCATNCVNGCGKHAQSFEALRVGLFGSVAQ